MTPIILQARGILHERTSRGHRLLRLETPRLRVAADVDVNETTGALIGPTITQVDRPASLSRIRNVRGTRIPWTLPVYVKVGERRPAAQFVEASNVRIRIEISVQRALRVSPCRGQPEAGARPRAQPFYRLSTRQILVFDYRLDAEWWERVSSDEWEYKEVERGPVEEIQDRGNTGPQTPLTELAERTPCVLPPRGALYGRYEGVGDPVVHELQITPPLAGDGD